MITDSTQEDNQLLEEISNFINDFKELSKLQKSLISTDGYENYNMAATHVAKLELALIGAREGTNKISVFKHSLTALTANLFEGLKSDMSEMVRPQVTNAMSKIDALQASSTRLSSKIAQQENQAAKQTEEDEKIRELMEGKRSR